MNWLIGSTMLLASLAGGPLPPPPEEVMAVPPQLAERVEKDIVRTSPKQEKRLNKLVDFMFDSDGLAFEYIVEPTTSVAETFESGQGNCLSFTLLFMALADEANLRSYPREVNVPLGWRRDKELVFQSSHVNVGINTTNRKFIVDFEPDTILARRLSSQWRGTEVTKERALAHFYNNRAAELLAEGESEVARAWSEQALALSPDFTSALNNRGVIERRLGNDALAEKYFLEVLEHDDEDSGALFNLIGLYQRQGRHEDKQALQERVESMRPSDPYFQWEVGKHHEELGELGRARRFYGKAANMMPQEHEFHGALARVLEKLGHGDKAVDALSKAARYSHAGTREDYEARIENLRQEAGGDSSL